MPGRGDSVEGDSAGFRLKLDGHLNADKIELPEGVTLVTDAETVIVTCAKPKAEAEVTGGGDGAEPEVIGRKAGEEEAAEEK
jgi:large subunit ribosomal protein L25